MLSAQMRAVCFCTTSFFSLLLLDVVAKRQRRRIPLSSSVANGRFSDTLPWGSSFSWKPVFNKPLNNRKYKLLTTTQLACDACKTVRMLANATHDLLWGVISATSTAKPWSERTRMCPTPCSNMKCQEKRAYKACVTLSAQSLVGDMRKNVVHTLYILLTH